MDKLELAWETYEFYTEMVHELEIDRLNTMKLYHSFIKKELNPTQLKKRFVKNKINKSLNKLLVGYKKQLDAINQLTEIYKYRKLNGIPIPEERDMDIQLFFQLKNVTATLIEEHKILRSEINEVLS